MRRNRLVTWTILLLALGAPACAPALPPQHVRAAIPPLVGTVSWTERHVSAVPSDVSNGATVSLIDSTTGQTVGTTVTEANGSFTLNFGASFRPMANRPYILEAVRGLGVGGPANRAGASLARLRTLLFYEGTTWKSLTSGGLNLGLATTTVATLVSLRGLSTSDQANLVGKVGGSSFSASGTAIASTEFSHVHALVTAALAADQDPLEALSFDPAGGSLATQFLVRSRAVLLHDSFSPARATAGGTVSFTGQNLPTTGASVAVAGLPVATWSVNAARTQLTVTLPANAISGSLVLQQGASSLTGPFLPVAGTVGTLAGNGEKAHADGRGTGVMFSSPTGLVRMPDGTLFVADQSNNCIRKITPGGAVTTFAGSGAQGSADGTGTQAQFYWPTGLAADAAQNLYVVDYKNNRIRKVSPAGVVTTFAGSGAGYVDGTGTAALFNQPWGVTVDSGGNVFVADRINVRLRKITPEGVVSTFAGTGVQGAADGTGTAAQFAQPWTLTVDASDNVYVAEAFGYRIRKVTPAAVVTTLAGSYGVAGSADGTGAGATFNHPYGLAVDPTGNVYVADTDNHLIRKITPAGVVTTVLGATEGFVDGPAASARLWKPVGLAFAPDGTLYFCDQWNRRVRAWVP